MELVKPWGIGEGDAIGLIAPSQSAAHIEPRVWQIGLDRLRSLGFEVKVGEHVMERTGHTAGSMENRLADLTTFLEDDEVAAIMTVFGGYNSNHLLQHIDYDLVRKVRKVFVGYSDITAMNNAFLTKAGLVNFSGPAFVTFCQPDLPRLHHRSVHGIGAGGNGGGHGQGERTNGRRTHGSRRMTSAPGNGG